MEDYDDTFEDYEELKQDEQNELSEKLLHYSYQGDLKKVKELVNQGAYINYEDEYENKAIAFAVKQGHLEVVKYLVENENGANVNDGIIQASSNNHLDILKYLHSKGADLNYKHTIYDSDGSIDYSAIKQASREGHFEVVKYLAENGADINLGLEEAAYFGKLDVVKYLHQKGADIDKVIQDISNGNFGNLKEELTSIKEQALLAIDLKELQKSKVEESKKDFFEDVTDKVIKAMEGGDKAWQRTWDKLGTSNPYNPLTGTEYSGINKIALSLTGHTDPRFLTFKQATDLGYKIQKGSKSHPIIHFQLNEKEVENKETKEKEIVKIPSIKYFNVFNAEQIVGIPRLTTKDEQTKQFDEIKNVEELIKNSNANVVLGGNQPLYSPTEDLIRMPQKTQFHTPIDYYSTLLHELTHWTGHETRLDRLKQGGFASKSYAHEELVAELGSVFLSGKTGIALNEDHYKHHSQYLNSWISLLKEDKNALYKASSQAQKATDYVMKYSPEQSNTIEMIKGNNKEQEQTKAVEQPQAKRQSLSMRL